MGERQSGGLSTYQHTAGALFVSLSLIWCCLFECKHLVPTYVILSPHIPAYIIHALHVIDAMHIQVVSPIFMACVKGLVCITM